MNALAAVFEGVPGRLSLRRLPLPNPGPGETLVRVLGCTLCGSDLHSLSGRRTVPTPTVLGHEIVGEVMAIGDPDGESPSQVGESPLQVGERITWAIVAHCGRCSYCRRGLPQKCLRGVKYGHEAFRPGRELLGGLAECCLLVPGTTIVRLPESLPLEVACPASCATATIAAAWESVGELRGRSVCVFGAGMLGLTACAWAADRGAARIVCIDPLPARRERAARFGATAAAAPEAASDLAALTEDGLGFDAILELSGSPAAFESALPLLRMGGTLALVGAVCPTPPVAVAMEQIVRRQLTLRGLHNYAPRHLRAAVEFLARRGDRHPFAELVSTWIGLPEVESALQSDAAHHAIRIGVRP